MDYSYLIRTDSLATDDRFDKTLEFLLKAGHQVHVYAVVKHVTKSNLAKVTQKKLFLRTLFPANRAKVLKFFELLFGCAVFLFGRRGGVWYANFDFMPLHFLSCVFASSKKQIVWDLHEMPPELTKKHFVSRWIISFLLRKSKVIICNHSRKRALELNYGVNLTGALVLRNYPSKFANDFLISARMNYLDDLGECNDLNNIVITGGFMPGRCVEESIEVVQRLRQKTGRDIRVKLVGGPDMPNMPSFVTSTGRLPFLKLLSHCVTGAISLCFYDRATENNLYCEPNRFYQGLIANQFVVTFEHPSLVEKRHPAHVEISQDRFPESLEEALLDLFDKTSGNVGPAANVDPCEFVFESQFDEFRLFLNSL